MALAEIESVVNPYESGARKLIPAVLIYVFAGDRVLMLHRNAKKDDVHSGKWNGLGGKLEIDESAREAARRELEEESGLALQLDQFKPLGCVLFPNFKPQKSEDWFCSIFVVTLDRSTKEMMLSGPEGELHWIEVSKVLDLPLWRGDQEFLPYVLAHRPFQGTIWYSGETVLRAEILPLSD